MDKRRKIAITVAGGVAACTAAGAAYATGMTPGAEADDKPLTGTTLQKATQAALAETGAGKVTGSEQEGQGKYEVEVTLPDGSVIDVELDRDFTVISSGQDSENEDGNEADEGSEKNDGAETDEGPESTEGTEGAEGTEGGTPQQ